MTREMDFRKPKLRECTTPSSLCLCQYPPEVSHCSRNGQHRKGRELYFKCCISVIKIRWKLQVVGFSRDKRVNVVM